MKKMRSISFIMKDKSTQYNSRLAIKFLKKI